jgi:hypothetical protein
MENQQSIYDYLEKLAKRGSILRNRIEVEWDLLTLEEIENITFKLETLMEEAQQIYSELENDEMEIFQFVHSLECDYQDAEELRKEIENKQ